MNDASESSCPASCRASTFGPPTFRGDASASNPKSRDSQVRNCAPPRNDRGGGGRPWPRRRMFPMSPRAATLIGLTAILMWSLLSVMTVATGRIPAFQLASMTFAIGGVVGLSTWIGRPDAIRALKQPPVAWIVGVGGLFGYHALYFLALRFAPPAEAGLLNYLWPLLIVLFSSLLPGERLAPHHIVGALLGLCGTVLLFAGNSGHGFAPGQLPGLIAAFVAAFVWAAYSVMSRKLKSVPTDAVAGFCAATALLAAVVHGLVEVTVWPESLAQWLAITALGVGPVG